MAILEFKNYDVADVNWLLKATAKKSDSRPALEGIKVSGDEAMASNGHILFIAPAPDCMKEHDEKLLSVNRVLKSNPITKAEEIDAEFPDIAGVIENAKHENPAKICVSAKYLKDAIAGMGKKVVIEFGDKDNPITVRSLSNENVAYIMPIHQFERK